MLKGTWAHTVPQLPVCRPFVTCEGSSTASATLCCLLLPRQFRQYRKRSPAAPLSPVYTMHELRKCVCALWGLHTGGELFSTSREIPQTYSSGEVILDCTTFPVNEAPRWVFPRALLGAKPSSNTHGRTRRLKVLFSPCQTFNSFSFVRAGARGLRGQIRFRAWTFCRADL